MTRALSAFWRSWSLRRFHFDGLTVQRLTVYCQIFRRVLMSHQPTAPADSPARLAFYERISRSNMTPLWVSLANLVTPEPASACRPAAWRFADIRAAMMEAGELITAKEAQRRV